LQNFVIEEAKRLAPSSVAKMFRTLRPSLRWAVERGELAQNPCTGIRLPRIEYPEIQVLSADELYVKLIFQWGFIQLRG
jgi:site-specific recombinase XerC